MCKLLVIAKLRSLSLLRNYSYKTTKYMEASRTYSRVSIPSCQDVKVLCWLCPYLVTTNSVNWLLLVGWFICKILVYCLAAYKHVSCRCSKEGGRIEIGIFLAFSCHYSVYCCAYAGGKMWIQGNNRYVSLLCHLGSTDVNYIITRWFLL